MVRFRLIFVLGLFLLLNLAPRAAHAAEVFGTWRSSTGNVFDVSGSRSGDFKLLVSYPTGTRTLLRGNWVPGLAGTQFQYWDGDAQFTGTFNPRDPDKVRVASSTNTASWWQRDAVPPPPVRTSSKVFGVWRSTSGNLFEVTEASGGGFGLLLTYTTGRKLSLRGDWVRGLRGTQFEYWDADRRYEGTFNAEDPDRVRVSSPANVTWWVRNSSSGPTAVAVSPAAQPPPPERRYTCWQAGDPGCEKTKDGKSPMDRDTFAAFAASVRSASPHVFSMLERFKSGLAQGYLTSRQLANVLDSFRPHVFPMLDAVKAAAPKLVDPQLGAAVISEKFAPHTTVGNDAAAVVSAQRGDP